MMMMLTMLVLCQRVIIVDNPAALQVMVPPVGDILDVLYANAQFSRLVSFLKAINFAEAFQSDEIVTFFAPTNEVISFSFTHKQKSLATAQIL